jgi:nucleotidyltransferase substrate binding protein (TIGR01987 family)
MSAAPRDAIREAFSAGLIDDGEGWMQMLVDRNRTSHTYREATAAEIVNNILGRHYSLLQSLQTSMQTRIDTHDH